MELSEWWSEAPLGELGTSAMTDGDVGDGYGYGSLP